MSVDIRIERFGLEMFNRLFSDYEVEGHTPQPLTADYADVESEVNEDIVRTVKVFMGFFHSYYVDVYNDTYESFRRNQMDFLDVLIDCFPHHELPLDDEVAKLAASCAFVADMCLIGLNKGDSDFVSAAHLLWAMFVDVELKEDFYAAGGWRALRRMAYGFRPLFAYLMEHNETSKRYLQFFHGPWVRAVDALNAFYEVDHPGGDPLALRWVDFVAKGHHPTFDPDDLDLSCFEDCLADLKRYCDPHGIQEYLALNAALTAEASGMREKDCMDALAAGRPDLNPELFEMVGRLLEEFKNENERYWGEFLQSFSDPSTVLCSAQNGVVNVDHTSSAIDNPLGDPLNPQSHNIPNPSHDAEDFNPPTIVKPIKTEGQYGHGDASFRDLPQPEAVGGNKLFQSKLISEFQQCFPKLMSSMPGSLSKNNNGEENSRTVYPTTSIAP